MDIFVAGTVLFVTVHYVIELCLLSKGGAIDQLHQLLECEEGCVWFLVCYIFKKENIEKHHNKDC